MTDQQYQKTINSSQLSPEQARKLKKTLWIIMGVLLIIFIGVMYYGMYYAWNRGIERGYKLCEEGQPLYIKKIGQENLCYNIRINLTDNNKSE